MSFSCIHDARCRISRTLSIAGVKPFVRTLLILAFLNALSTIVAAQTTRSDRDTITDFELRVSPVSGLTGAKVAIVSKRAAQGKNYLSIEPGAAQGQYSYVRLRIPPDVSFVGRGRLSAKLRVSSASAKAGDGIELYWFALNANGQEIFIRKLNVEPGDAWTQVSEPLRLWRWWRYVGDWDEIKELALRIRWNAATRVDLDDIRLEQTASADERTNWLLNLAFQTHARRTVTADGLLVATNAVNELSDADVQCLLNNMTATRKFIRRIFGAAVHQTDRVGSPPMLLIFRSEDAQVAFLHRLGQEWDAHVAERAFDGLTVHDIAMGTYVEKLGVRQPVFLHESVHAVVTRDLRLLTGDAPQGVLQEAIATYVQIALQPDYMTPEEYAAAFSQRIDGRGRFKPLGRLFSEMAHPNDYAQLASVFAYLVEADPALLRDLTSGFADGESVGAILKRHGTTMGALQVSWQTWGRERFVPNQGNEKPSFEQPAEFR